MTEPAPSPPSHSPAPSPLARAVRPTHRSVLALLGCCAIVTLLQGFPDEEPPPDRWVATVGVGLGLGSIVLRRLGASPVIRARSAALLLAASLVLAGGLGLLGAWTAWRDDATRTGLLFTLAGLIFALRPIAPAARRR